MTKCTECKYFTEHAIYYNRKHYLCCEIEGLIAEDVALDDNLECDLFVDNVDDDH